MSKAIMIEEGDMQAMPDAQDQSQVEGPSYLHSVLSLIWPGAEIRPAHPIRPVPLDQVEFLALPSTRAPAMLIPARPRNVASAALREAKTGGAASRRHLLRALSLGASVGVTTLLPERLVVHPVTGRASLVDWLGEVFGEPVAPSIFAGPPRANRKPVLQLISRQGRTLGFAKLGTSDLANRLMATEASALRALQGHPGRHVRSAELLAHDVWEGMEVLVQRPLVPEGPQAWSPADLHARMFAVAGGQGVETTILANSPFVHRLRLALPGVDDPDVAKQIGDLLDALTTAHGDLLLPLGVWHGDWAPWNMARAGEDLLLWDWERFEKGVPLGFDALHHDLQSAVVRGGKAPRAAALAMLERSATTGAAFDLDPAVSRACGLLYLVHLGIRYATDRQRNARALSDVQTWLLPMLADERRRLTDRA